MNLYSPLPCRNMRPNTGQSSEIKAQCANAHSPGETMVRADAVLSYQLPLNMTLEVVLKSEITEVYYTNVKFLAFTG